METRGERPPPPRKEVVPESLVLRGEPLLLDPDPTADIPSCPPIDPVLQTGFHLLYPMGSNTPPRGAPSSIKPPMAVRVTLRVVEWGAEKQERLISRVVWLAAQ